MGFVLNFVLNRLLRRDHGPCAVAIHCTLARCSWRSIGRQLASSIALQDSPEGAWDLSSCNLAFRLLFIILPLRLALAFASDYLFGSLWTALSSSLSFSHVACLCPLAPRRGPVHIYPPSSLLTQTTVMMPEMAPAHNSSDTCSDSTSSPSTSPSAALSAGLVFGRSVSGTSSITTTSVQSSNTASGDTISSKRRGFTRPHGTAFASSARNRDSVMSLGTIAHLQHYFARTGLLDGKGAQLAREDQKDQKRDGSSSSSDSKRHSGLQLPNNQSSSPSPRLEASDVSYADDNSFVSSPDGLSLENSWEDDKPLHLPPTVSTYKEKPTYVPPPPNLSVLRHELREALGDARKLMSDIQGDEDDRCSERVDKCQDSQSPQGWYEIQGLQVLDLVTLAIRAAKNFYTSHEQPKRLYSVRSERKIRADLFDVLDTLKRLASRNFAGGIRKSETEKILSWITKIDDLVSQDEELENQEHEQRQLWTWLNDEWAGREREREWAFLKSFDPHASTLPGWTAPAEDDTDPTPFLHAMRNGLRLVRLHNELVEKSRRQFELIKVYHTDTAKPYRCAENLRYWMKASELRWDTGLDVDVHGVVHGTGAAAWQRFDRAILRWCKAVREEITKEWQEHREALKTERPIVKMDPATDMDGVPW